MTLASICVRNPFSVVTPAAGLHGAAGYGRERYQASGAGNRLRIARRTVTRRHPPGGRSGFGLAAQSAEIEAFCSARGVLRQILVSRRLEQTSHRRSPRRRQFLHHRLERGS